MVTNETLLLSSLIFFAAILYSSVGHGGASGYLAVMALFGVAPHIMKPTALILNIFVSSIATIRFYKSGHFSWQIFLPFALSSIPFAFFGGMLNLSAIYYKPIVGCALLFSAFMLLQKKVELCKATKKPPMLSMVFSGAGIGLLSGLSGVGGGIFLGPLLLFMGWATAKETSGVSAAFILVNSISGILGHLSKVKTLPNQSLLFFAMAAVLGGLIGSHFGSRRFTKVTLLRLLAIVLIIAGIKLILNI